MWVALGPRHGGWALPLGKHFVSVWDLVHSIITPFHSHLRKVLYMPDSQGHFSEVPTQLVRGASALLLPLST